MAIITISRGSYSKGREVAEKTAARLGYRVVSRDLLLEASDRYDVPEVKLVRAIHDAPSILDRFTYGKQGYIAYIRSALTDLAAADNLVYHGLAGHLLLKGVPHVLKVRIIADLGERTAAEMLVNDLTEPQARSLILKDDAERRKWTQSLYGADPWDPYLYDLVLHIHKLNADDAVDLIVEAAGRDSFRTTAESQRKMEDLALACRIKAALVKEECVNLSVTCEYGNVVVYPGPGGRHPQHLDDKLEAVVRKMPGINHLEVHDGQPVPPAAV